MKYRTTNYDLIAIEVRKGKRDAYKMAASELGLTFSMLVQNAVEGYVQNHADEELQKKFARLIQEIEERAAQKKICDGLKRA